MLATLPTLLWDEAYKKKCLPPGEIQEKIAFLKKAGKTIVTLNGSFDLLHPGHLEIIFAASQQGDVLIVALNTDASIKAYKTPHRPIIPLQERLKMMAALSFVSYVTWFDETDPRNLLSKIAPDVHVNGADYGENCLEAETVRAHGGRLVLVPIVPGLSTSALIKKIKELPI